MAAVLGVLLQLVVEVGQLLAPLRRQLEVSLVVPLETVRARTGSTSRSCCRRDSSTLASSVVAPLKRTTAKSARPTGRRLPGGIYGVLDCGSSKDHASLVQFPQKLDRLDVRVEIEFLDDRQVRSSSSDGSGISRLVTTKPVTAASANPAAQIGDNRPRGGAALWEPLEPVRGQERAWVLRRLLTTETMRAVRSLVPASRGNWSSRSHVREQHFDVVLHGRALRQDVLDLLGRRFGQLAVEIGDQVRSLVRVESRNLFHHRARRPPRGDRRAERACRCRGGMPATVSGVVPTGRAISRGPVPGAT